MYAGRVYPPLRFLFKSKKSCKTLKILQNLKKHKSTPPRPKLNFRSRGRGYILRSTKLAESPPITSC